jgi:hypothetical protein
MRLMRMLGVALVWVLGVALVASVSWVAINSAGRQVVDTTVVTTIKADGDVVGMLPTISPSTRPASPSMSTAATSTTTRTPGSALDVPVSASRQESGQPTTRSQTPRPQVPSSPPSAGPLSDTLVTAGGVVWLECTGASISNSLVQPHDGWSAERYQQPWELGAHFDRRDVRIDVQATCAGGQPRFSMRTEKRDHDEYGGD